jgi:hypothetical protein
VNPLDELLGVGPAGAFACPKGNAPVRRTTVTIRFSAECWEFLQGVGSEAPSRLRDDVRSLLERVRWVLVIPPEPPRIVELHMQRMHAWELMIYIGATSSVLSPADPRRRLCEQCLAELEEGILGS